MGNILDRGIVIGALVNIATLADTNVPFMAVLALAYFAFLSVAIWRCAQRYILIHPTRRGWGYLAQGAVVLGALGTVARFIERVHPLT